MSDHCPILCKLTATVAHTKTTKYNYIKANWTQYKHLIDTINPPGNLLTTADIDQAIESFSSHIISARDRCPHNLSVWPITPNCTWYC